MKNHKDSASERSFLMAKVIGSPLPNIPWEDKPAACKDVV